MRTFKVSAKPFISDTTGRIVCTLDIETDALVVMTHYCGDRIDLSIHTTDLQELKNLCKQISDAGDKL